MSIIIWFLATAGSALVLTQSTIAAPLRDWLGKHAELSARIAHLLKVNCGPCSRRTVATSGARATLFQSATKLVSCPMCSGFWFGLGWAAALGTRGPALVAHAFGGSVVSALAVAAWIALIEAQQALALWRYNNSKDPPPEGVCEERMQLAFRSGVGPMDVICPRHGALVRGEKCPER